MSTLDNSRNRTSVTRDDDFKVAVDKVVTGEPTTTRTGSTYSGERSSASASDAKAAVSETAAEAKSAIVDAAEQAKAAISNTGDNSTNSHGSSTSDKVKSDISDVTRQTTAAISDSAEKTKEKISEGARHADNNQKVSESVTSGTAAISSTVDRGTSKIKDAVTQGTDKIKDAVDQRKERGTYTGVVPGYSARDITAQQKSVFGGFKFGSAFFGWVTATGLFALLAALVSGIGINVASGLGNLEANTSNGVLLGTFIALAVVLFVAYYCGGYVAGRMARFDGMKQGVAVWAWGIVVAIIGAILTVVTPAFSFLTDSIPGGIQISNFGGVAALSLGIAVVVSLVAAILGGLAGMRFHRKIDKLLDENNTKAPAVNA